MLCPYNRESGQRRLPFCDTEGLYSRDGKSHGRGSQTHSFVSLCPGTGAVGARSATTSATAEWKIAWRSSGRASAHQQFADGDRDLSRWTVRGAAAQRVRRLQFGREAVAIGAES